MAIPLRLQVFEGPMDLLMHLIDKNKIDIYDIPIVTITDQYLEYVRQMEHEDMDVTSEFLVMAATLLDIKSRMLLPKEEEDEEGDPRDELVQRLLEYKMVKYMSEELRVRSSSAGLSYYKAQDLPQEVRSYVPPIDYEELIGDRTLQSLQSVFRDVMRRKNSRVDPIRSGFGEIRREEVNVADKELYVRAYLENHPRTDFRELLETADSKEEVIVTFLVVLELMKHQKIRITQEETFGTIIIELYTPVTEDGESPEAGTEDGTVANPEDSTEADTEVDPEDSTKADTEIDTEDSTEPDTEPEKGDLPEDSVHEEAAMEPVREVYRREAPLAAPSTQIVSEMYIPGDDLPTPEAPSAADDDPAADEVSAADDDPAADDVSAADNDPAADDDPVPVEPVIIMPACEQDETTYVEQKPTASEPEESSYVEQKQAASESECESQHTRNLRDPMYRRIMMCGRRRAIAKRTRMHIGAGSGGRRMSKYRAERGTRIWKRKRVKAARAAEPEK